MNREFLESAGKLLFGNRWQTDIAELISVNDRTVRRWISGKSEIPAGIKPNIISALKNRQKMIADFVKSESGEK